MNLSAAPEEPVLTTGGVEVELGATHDDNAWRTLMVVSVDAQYLQESRSNSTATLTSVITVYKNTTNT